MDELSILGTGFERLETQRKTIIVASKVKCETTVAKIELTRTQVLTGISSNTLCVQNRAGVGTELKARD
jgi:hypothetical protein